ncbi:hypothetical protein HYY74_05955 [Candidatus Woesearchaeota archaeon]|nr:hypothetical protein [Candidatus Woesearchaeota archaeon]
MTEEPVNLGANIQLTGFRELDPGSMTVLRKMIGNHARRFSEICRKFEMLKLQMKPIHESDRSEKYEVHGFLQDNGKHFSSHASDINLFFAVDRVLKKLEHEIGEK